MTDLMTTVSGFVTIAPEQAFHPHGATCGLCGNGLDTPSEKGAGHYAEQVAKVTVTVGGVDFETWQHEACHDAWMSQDVEIL